MVTHYKLILFVLALLLSSATSQAQLGETEQESIKRYGNVTPDPPPNISELLLPNAINRTYLYQGWRIQTSFLNNHTVRIRYSKLPKKNVSQVLHKDEIATILKVEAHGGNWKKIAKKSFLIPHTQTNVRWQRAQTRFVNTNGCRAYLTAGYMNLYVDAPEAVLWEETTAADQAQQQKENIPSF